jgi:molybdate transport system regulatory protein
MTRLMLRLYFSPDAWLGPGKVQLLEAIRDRGSISAAARTMGMSYRRAWLLIEHVNGMFREPAVHTTLGGTGGGAATLTAFGDALVTRYRRMERDARRAMTRDLTALERAYRPTRALHTEQGSHAARGSHAAHDSRAQGSHSARAAQSAGAARASHASPSAASSSSASSSSPRAATPRHARSASTSAPASPRRARASRA